MPKRQVFYSFHYERDAMRAQQVRNIGVIEGNAPVSPNEWEQVQRKGDSAIKRWIDTSLEYRSAVVVLVGQETANRPWVRYEIQRGWELGKAVFGIRIHNLRCPRQGTSQPGANPFDRFDFGKMPFSSIVPCYDPYGWDAYGHIAENMDGWIENALAIRNRHS